MSDRGQGHAPDVSGADPEMNGFSAHLQGVSLHALIMLQALVRATGVYLVLFEERAGELHFWDGALIHAETAQLAGDAALIEMLSWPTGELVSSNQPLAESVSISLNVEQLLGRAGPPALAGDRDRAKVTGIRRRLDSGPAENHARAAPSAQLPRDRPEGTGMARALAAAATPGTAAAARRHVSRAPDVSGEVQVLLSGRGDLIDQRGTAADALASRAAYIMRVLELIAEAMGAGAARSLDARSPTINLSVRRHADGRVSASCHGARLEALDAAASASARYVGTPAPIDPGRALQSLRDIDGVYGSFIVDGNGAPRARDLSPVFDDATLAESGRRIVQLWDVLSDTGSPEEALLGFSEYGIYLRRVDAGSLCVVAPPNVNVLALRHASRWVSRQLAL